MGPLTNISIRGKLSLLILLAALGVGVLAWEGYRTAQELAESLDRVGTTTVGTRHLMTGDMMHDALAGNVQVALRLSSDASAEKKKEVTDDTQANATRLLDSMREVRALPLEPDILAQVDAVDPKLKRYIAMARDMVVAALTDPQRAQNSEEAFNAAFEDLAESLEKVSGQFVEFADAERDRGAQLAAAFPRRMAISAAIALLLLTLGAFAIHRALATPIVQLNEGMKRLAADDIDVALPEAVRRDEIGDMARSVLVFQENSQ
ncbi:MAG: HAMP domain-containing protein [Telmatospirillum sp.]|nr:HAMP domain-containing protein [Telmatospirillum sp.]